MDDESHRPGDRLIKGFTVHMKPRAAGVGEVELGGAVAGDVEAGVVVDQQVQGMV